MAEAFLNRECPNDFAAESAGLEPGRLNPLVVTVMREVGIDISKNRTKSAFDLSRTGRQFCYVITVCDAASAEQCPFFPGEARRLHWSFRDPGNLKGSLEYRLAETRRIRDEIRERIRQWCTDVQNRRD